jgi:membrane-associated phospholipid phosphatase
MRASRPSTRSLAPIDLLTIAYAVVALAFTATLGPERWSAVLLPALAACGSAVLAALLAPRARASGPLGRLLAEVYPLLVTVAFYTHAGLVNRARGRFSHDALVQGWEEALFGTQVSVLWIRSFPSPAWSSLMHAAYLAYYALLAAPPLALWLGGRRAGARQAVFATKAPFYVCYTIFMGFPVAGPRYLLPPAQNAATAVPLAQLAHWLLERGSAWGTAFPSSHVAGALVASTCSWWHWRALGAVLLPASLLLSLATVYCQFHYAVDALAGALLAALLLVVVPRRLDAWEERVRS